MSAALAPVAPVDLATLHRAAQARLARHPQGVGFQACPYGPLVQLVHRGEQLGGRARVDALTACQAVVDADDAAIAQMLRELRPSPVTMLGAEIVAARVAQHDMTSVPLHRRELLASIMAARPRLSLAEQLAAMEGRGIRITVHQGDLHVSALPGVLTDGDRTLLREHKDAIAAFIHDGAKVF